MAETAASPARRATQTTHSSGFRRVMLLGVRHDAMLHLAPQLKTSRVVLESAEDAAAALAACRERRFDLVIVRHPLSGTPIDEFLAGLRASGARSSQAFVLVLTEMASSGALDELSGRRSRFANLTDFDRILSVVAREVLGVAPRAASRMMVELGLRLEGRSLSRFCQVVNLSESGMLVKSGDLVPPGEEVEVVFSLPDGTPPIRSRAVVVRHTEGREPQGFALTFSGLDLAARGRIADFVRARLADA